MKTFFNLILLISNLVGLSLTYSNYQEQIPNGANVPHPCKVNYRWPGVGHENPLGGGARNPFGLDFVKHGHVWTQELCNADSDGDGRKNGEELGDPDCTWKSGTVPTRTDNISHPGVCDPYNSTICQGRDKFVTCELQRFEACERIKKPEVKTLDFKFPVTKVPPKETNYFCMTFNLPTDQDYHVIANEPIIDNRNVLHHMVLYGCESLTDLSMPTPEPCGMSNFGVCTAYIGRWTVGLAGSCLSNTTGYKIGLTGYKLARLEVHYNNPTLSDDFTDSSGLRIYYQPARPDIQDLISFTTGQMILEIPPGQNEVPHVGVCPSSCTRVLFAKPAYVTAVYNHMHYLGKSAKMEVFRNGAMIKNIGDDTTYSYDSPVEHIHEPAFELLPGDEIITTCVFSSLSSKRYVYYGDGTSDEMCYGLVTIYPSDAVNYHFCLSFLNLSMCDVNDGTPLGQCNWREFTNFTANAKIVSDVMKNCNLDGFCRPECVEVLKGLENHPCLNGEAKKYITNSLESSKEGLQFLARLHSCSKSAVTCRVTSDNAYSLSAGAMLALIVSAIVLLA